MAVTVQVQTNQTVTVIPGEHQVDQAHHLAERPEVQVAAAVVRMQAAAVDSLLTVRPAAAQAVLDKVLRM